MRTGTLNKRVTIEYLAAGSPQQNSGGEPDESWTTFGSFWAAISPLKGREFTTAQQISEEVTGTIKVHYRSGITSKMRVKFGTRYYDILAVIDPDEANQELVLYVKEGVNVG